MGLELWMHPHEFSSSWPDKNSHRNAAPSFLQKYELRNWDFAACVQYMLNFMGGVLTDS